MITPFSFFQFSDVKLVWAAVIGSSLMGCGYRTPAPNNPSQTAATAEVVTSREEATPATGSVTKLPILGKVPPFDLIDQDNQPIDLSRFYGKAWIANFMFTRCTATCPAQTIKLAELAARLQDDLEAMRLRLVSITVDPEHDTPKILSEYASSRSIDTGPWDFITGTRQDLWRLCREGFKMPVGEDAQNSEMPIFHGSQFVLIDQQGRIRGYYDGLTDTGLAALKRDLSIIIAEIKPVPDEILNPPWLQARAEAQREAVRNSNLFHDFAVTDRRRESGITFVNRVVPDAAKRYQATHYDHGNGVAAADVDEDGLIDLYFVSQLGGNQLWKNLGAGQFENITSTAGVALEGRVGVTATFADLDNDGDPDLYVTTVRGGNALFRNDGKGKFSDVSHDAGVGHVGHSSGALCFDYDRDGRLDIFLCNVGVYTTNELAPEGYYVAHKDAFAGHLKPDERNERSLLFRNLGDLKFADVTESVNLKDESWTGDATAIDANDDGWLDLYVLNMQGHNEYYENIEGREFRRRSRELFPKTPWGAMGVKVFDFDNDGRLDLYITDMHSDMSQQVTFEHEKEKSNMIWPESLLLTKGQSIWGNALFRQLGPNQYEEVSDRVGAENYWPWGMSVGDLNADGFDDVFIASSMNFPFRYAINSLLLNDRGDRFIDAEFAIGVEPRSDRRTALPWFELDCSGADKGHIDCEGRAGTVVTWSSIGSRSSVLFDLDNDGDLDIVTNDFGSEPLILVSNLSQKSETMSYLKIKLIGQASNRDGCGALVKVTIAGRSFLKVNDGKSGYLSQSVLPLYFGLDRAKEVDSVEVVWPTGKKQIVAGPMTTNQIVVIREVE